MTTVRVLPATPATGTGAGGRTTMSAAAEDFAAMLAGLVSGAVPAAVATAVPATGEAAPVVASEGVGAAAVAPAQPDLAAAPDTAGSVPATAGAPVALPVAGAGTATGAVLPGAAADPAAPVVPAAPGAPVQPGPAARSGPAARPDTTTASVQAAVTSVVTSTDAAAPVPTASSTPGTSRPAAVVEVPQDAPTVDADAATTEPAPLGGEAGSDDAAGDHRPALPVAPAGTTETSRPAGPVSGEPLAVAPLTDSRAVTAPAAPPPPPPPPAPPATQVVTQLAPVLEGPDGSYTMSLKLYPDELGAVQVEVSLRGGEISLALHAADDLAKDVLRSVLPQLREQLEATGLTATDVTVDSGKPDDQRDEPATPRRGGSPATDGAETPMPTPAPDPDAALDLRM